MTTMISRYRQQESRTAGQQEIIEQVDYTLASMRGSLLVQRGRVLQREEERYTNYKITCVIVANIYVYCAIKGQSPQGPFCSSNVRNYEQGHERGMKGHGVVGLILRRDLFGGIFTAILLSGAYLRSTVPESLWVQGTTYCTQVHRSGCILRRSL